MVSFVFWKILGLGLAIPFTLIIVTNIVISARKKETYDLDIPKVLGFYLVAILGWAITFGIK